MIYVMKMGKNEIKEGIGFLFEKKSKYTAKGNALFS